MSRLVAFLLVCLGLTPLGAFGQQWSEYAFISQTLGVSGNRLCLGEDSRGELGCPAYAPSVSPTGRVTVGGGLTVNTVSLTTGGTTWGYLGSGGGYLPNLASNAVQIISASGPLACDAGKAGTLRYNSPTTALELCTGTGWQVMGVGIPAGTISAFASTTCPTGWSEYTPARGRFPRGIDPTGINDPSGIRAVGSTQEDAFQGHNHNVYDNYGGSSAELPYWHQGTRNMLNGHFTRNTTAELWGWKAKEAVTDGTNGAPRISSETRPKNFAVTFCQFNGTSNGWNTPLSGGSTTAAGTTGHIQYNTGGSFDVNAGLTWDTTTSRLTATNISTTALTLNGVAITGGAWGDRITSGSTSVVASASGAVRVSGSLGLSENPAEACAIENLGNLKRSNGKLFMCRQ